MEWHFHALDATAALAARRTFLAFLRASCTPESDCEAAEIVFGELVANVMRHAPGSIDITARADAYGLVTLDVRDSGSAFTYAPALPESVFCDSGRGLHIVSQLCAHVALESDGNGKKVSVVLPVMADFKLNGRSH
jgi:anti-sigma regulatory factor (Ser/Thr protein kinase)